MKKTTIITALLSLLMPAVAHSQLIDYGKADKFIETEVHLLAGGSYVTENYKSCYPKISDVNNSMGFAWGVGARVQFNISSFVGIGTEFNYLRNTGKMDMAVLGEQRVSNIYLKNTYRTINIPIFASFTFNLANDVKWIADGGLFLNFGTGGKQKYTEYMAEINPLGQLITEVIHHKWDYYKNNKTFINSYRDFDMGLHLGTGMKFFDKVSVGVRFQFGFRNVAMSDGLVKPNSHNIGVLATAGYIF